MEKVKKKTAQAENSPGDAVEESELLAPSKSDVSTGDAFGAFLGMSYNGNKSYKWAWETQKLTSPCRVALQIHLEAAGLLAAFMFVCARSVRPSQSSLLSPGDLQKLGVPFFKKS